MATYNLRGWRTDGVMRPEVRRQGQEARRQAVRYSAAESSDMLAQFRLGFSVEEIAEWHERSVNGVSIQLYWLGEIKYKERMT